MWFIVILFIILVGGGWLIGKSFGNFLFPDKKENSEFTINNTHYHSHTHEHKHIHIIDDETKKNVLELKDEKHIKTK